MEPSSIEKACKILLLLSEVDDKPLSLGEIAELMAMNSSTCAYMMKCLLRCGLAEQDGPRKGYRLGSVAFSITRNGPYRKDIVRKAQPFMEELAVEINETIILVGIHQGLRILLHIIDGNPEVKMRRDKLLLPGTYATATGKLLLAHLPLEERLRWLRELGENEKRDEIEAEFARIRADGCCVLNAPLSQFVQVAFPVREGEEVAAALAVPVPRQRFENTERDDIIACARRTAEKIGKSLAAT
jgi:DNA-binding IclR family transcriptional regulator